MTDDHELLELAAKAAGMDIEWQPCGWAHDNETGCEWNPLTDDGDALRLAGRLRLSINLTYGDAAIVGQEHTQSQFCLERTGDDPYAATRRAIVRAAAEIGRSME